MSSFLLTLLSVFLVVKNRSTVPDNLCEVIINRNIRYCHNGRAHVVGQTRIKPRTSSLCSYIQVLRDH